MKPGKGHIVVIDDDPYILLSIKMLLEAHVDSVTCLHSPDLLPETLAARQIDVLILDMNYSAGSNEGIEGLHWIKQLHHLDPSISIVALTAYGEIDLAVKAVRAGAIEFVSKPWQNDKLLTTVLAAWKLNYHRRKSDRWQATFARNADPDPIDQIIGSSAPMKEVFSMIRKVGPTDANVLILGENGTGKELVAQAIHGLSRRREEACVSVDLGALSAGLFESELFGHVKGAFTDAKADRMGKMEAANGGTLFLDEIGNLALAHQSKLLRALQERKISRVGSSRVIDLDLRLISATNASISSMVSGGQFREDLFYRINTIEIVIPPLRDRREDIGLLARHFLGRYARKYHRPELSLGDELIQRLMRYPWPGNVRELQHAMERAVIMATQDRLSPTDFFFLEQEVPDSPAGTLNLEELEAWAIRTALVKHGGNVSQAARELGITRGAMYRRMEKYGL